VTGACSSSQRGALGMFALPFESWWNCAGTGLRR